LIVILTFMIVFDKFVISGTISQVNHIDGRIVNEPSELNQEEVERLAVIISAISEEMREPVERFTIVSITEI